MTGVSGVTGLSVLSALAYGGGTVSGPGEAGERRARGLTAYQEAAMPDAPTGPARDPLATLKLPPGWYAWAGVGGILYARRLKSSPPIVVRAATAEELAVKVAEELAKRR